MKQFLLIMTMTLLSYLHCPADVVYKKIDGLEYKLDSSDHSAIVSRQSTSLSGAITIPLRVTDGASYTVKGLVNEAFMNCKGITSVTIPSSITELSRYCFSGCDSLTNVTIPSSVTYIKEYCFSHCM